MRIQAAIGGLFALVSGLIWTFAAVGAPAAGAEEEAFASRVAAERSSAGLPGYAGAGDLVEVARRHAARMAAEDRLYHNPALGSEVPGWEAVGENVGVGASVDDVHRAFMASATHRHAILSTDFTQVGMGVAFGADGRLWVAQVFRRPAAAAGSAPAPTAARSTPAPQPAPDPAAVAAAREARDAVKAAKAARAAAEADAAAAQAARRAEEAARAAEAEAAARAELTQRLRADLGTAPSAAAPATPAVLARVEVAGAPSDRRVTWPIGLAASALLAVVVGLAAEVIRGGVRYPLSDWRRQRNQASISSSRSPSSTAWTLPVS